MTDLKFIEAAVDAQAERILDANDRIWEYAEPPFKEMQSSALLGRLLKEAGFTVRRVWRGFQPALQEPLSLEQENR